MKEKIKAIFSWSGGKDSAMCLARVREEGIYDIVFLLTTLNTNFRRVSMHGVREELLDAQALALGLPLRKVWVSEGTNAEYERQMGELLQSARTSGVRTVIFGDIFLEDLRAYRERNLAAVDMEAVFPLWKEDTTALAHTFTQKGFRAVTCCVTSTLGDSMIGRELGPEFFTGLPATTDPCGENGEYHTFCYDGPVFAHPVRFVVGEKVYRPISGVDTGSEALPAGFWFCDLLPPQP